MKKLWNWLLKSNRLKHFIGGGLIGAFADDTYCAVYSGGLVAAALEFKDKQHGCAWDWIDFSLTLLGAILGRLLRLLLNAFF